MYIRKQDDLLVSSLITIFSIFNIFMYFFHFCVKMTSGTKIKTNNWRLYIMGKNAYELMKEMIAIDNQIQKLTDELKSTSNIAMRNNIERKIDSLYADFLKHKHYMQTIKVNTP